MTDMLILYVRHDTALYFAFRFEAEWITRLNVWSFDKQQSGKDPLAAFSVWVSEGSRGESPSGMWGPCPSDGGWRPLACTNWDLAAELPALWHDLPFWQGWNRVVLFLLPKKCLKTHVSVTKMYSQKISLPAVMVLSARLLEMNLWTTCNPHVNTQFMLPETKQWVLLAWTLSKAVSAGIKHLQVPKGSVFKLFNCNTFICLYNDMQQLICLPNII